MKLLIRYIKKQGQNNIVEETMVANNKLKLGRGTDQNILLPDRRVALGHAKLTVVNDEVQVSTAVGKYVLFNNQMVKKCRLALGQKIDIVGHKISLLAGEQGCDFVIEVKLNNEQQASLKDRYQTRLQALNIGKRRWSWLLFLTIIFACLIVPIVGVLNPPVMETLRTSTLPDDSQWLAGKLMKSHQFMGANCSECHVEAFVQVNNQQCQSCHNETKHHVDVAGVEIIFKAFEQCTDCHKEHNDESTLATYSQQVCVSCHNKGNPKPENNVSGPSNANLPPLAAKISAIVTDFEQQHPSFTASMLVPEPSVDGLDKLSTQLSRKLTENNRQWRKSKVLLADQNSKEQSNLKFSHQLHMDENGINSATGKVTLSCNNCHEAEKGGLQMKAISMEKHCQSCHTLTFDADDPKRVVPHGSPTEVVMMMREYYAFRYIYQQLNISDENVIQTAGDLFSVRDARRPGRDHKLVKSVEQAMNAQTIATIEKLTKNTVRTDALLWAESRASNAAFNIFERQACNVCHLVTKTELADHNNNNDIPWQVEPVVLTKTWLPAARFSHDEHQASQCLDCHQVLESEHSTDILIPDIENCRQCHGGEHSDNRIPNTCIDCHDFHQAQQQPFIRASDKLTKGAH
ncbi:MAG: hypothetical protein ACSHW0_14115 [Thalassotalea sp.]